MRLFFIILAQILMFSIFFIMVALVVRQSNPDVNWYNFLLPIPACVYAANMFEFSVLKKYSYHVAITLMLILTFVAALPVFETTVGAVICALIISAVTSVCTFIVGRILVNRRNAKAAEKKEE